MNDTQRLLGIALAVLALDGCRGASTDQAWGDPSPSPSEAAAAGTTNGTHGVPHGGGGGFAAGVVTGSLLGAGRNRRAGAYGRGAPPQTTYSRVLGGNRGTAPSAPTVMRGAPSGPRGGWRGFFGLSGFHGGGG